MRVKGLPPQFRELELVLRNLDFGNNFGAVEETIVIGAGAEISFPNRLIGASGDLELPTQFIIVDIRRFANASGTISISRGNVAWTRERLTLRNDGSCAATITIKLFRGSSNG